MCQKIRLVNFHFKSSYYWKYEKSKNSAKYHKISMSRFWEIVFCGIAFLAAMFVCLIQDTRRHASYRWPPAKLCSATLGVAYHFQPL